ncbi:MAG: MBL fold metallo-hydrolase [Pseudomonadota bacterium]
MREELAPALQRLRAPNPGPLTGTGTNTYLVGDGPYVVIDPGPDLDAHLDAILSVTGAAISAILVTHSHLDHSALVPRLADEAAAPVYGFGPSGAGQSAIMASLGDTVGGGEGADPTFRPDITVADGQEIAIGKEVFVAHHTPGHFGNHLCFAWGDALFSGDHVMAWATTLVSPPHGDLTDFMSSCARLAALPARIFYPGHGAPVAEPQARIADLLAHRRSREAQILTALKAGDGTPQEITAQVYTDVAPALWPAAERNVLAHLIDLTGRGLVCVQGPLSTGATFHLT